MFLELLEMYELRQINMAMLFYTSITLMKKQHLCRYFEKILILINSQFFLLRVKRLATKEKSQLFFKKILNKINIKIKKMYSFFLDLKYTKCMHLNFCLQIRQCFEY